MKPYSPLSVLLLAVSLGLPGCDLDDSAGGDDAGGMGLALCSGIQVVAVEQEPNNGSNEAEINIVQSADGDVVLSGTTATCGNDGVEWTGDIDVFRVDFACEGLANFCLTWDSPDGTAADLDYNVLAPDWSVHHYASVGYQWGPEASGEAVESEGDLAGVGGPMLVRIMCWQGNGGQNWTFRIDWKDAANGVVEPEDQDAEARCPDWQSLPPSPL